MGKIIKIVVCGPSGVGKTSLIEQCIYGNYTERKPDECLPTFEDTYYAVIETDRGVKEKTFIYDFGGDIEIDRYFCQIADAFMFVYDLSDAKSFKAVQSLKRKCEEIRGDRECVFITCGNKADKNRTVETTEVTHWAQPEKVHVCEGMVKNREWVCTLFSSIVSLVNQPQSKSGFSFGKRKTRPVSVLWTVGSATNND